MTTTARPAADPHEQFRQQRAEEMGRMAQDEPFVSAGKSWAVAACGHRYAYNFTWLGRPIIQFPQDILAMQEILWKVQPDVVVEAGIARGGSLLLSASMLELMGGDGYVIGLDIDIRPHNRQAIQAHPLARRIRMIEGSSVDPAIVAQVYDMIGPGKRVVVALDSNHTHEHVLAEMKAYAPLVGAGSYLVVFDTIVEDMPDEMCAERPWARGDNPATAVADFLAACDRFEVDPEYERKLIVTAAPGGYLRCTRDPS